MTEFVSMDEPINDDQSTDGPSWAVSLCFWGTLIVAVSVYASVALTPKFCVWNEVRLEYRQNVAQLIQLEHDVGYLERVEAALKSDPEFRDRVSGMSETFKAGEEFIPVSGSLLFGQDDQPDSIAAASEMPVYHTWVLQLASQRMLRMSLLTFAAFLTIFAFTFLNDAGTNFVHATGQLLKSTALIPVGRYFASDKVSTAEDAKPSSDDES
jgi:hypothetical protein